MQNPSILATQRDSKNDSKGKKGVRNRFFEFELMKESDDRLKGMRYHFLFNAEKLDEELNALQKQQLRTSWAIRSRLELMKNVARMLKNWLENILSWFRHRITNSNAEGFNSRIQAVKSNARGFRSFQNYRTRILFFCGKMPLKPVLSCH